MDAQATQALDTSMNVPLFSLLLLYSAKLRITLFKCHGERQNTISDILCMTGLHRLRSIDRM